LYFGQVPYHYLFGTVQDDGVGYGMSLLWLGGGALYLALSRYCPPRWVSGLALCSSIVAYAVMVQPGKEYSVITYPALIIFAGSIVAITQWTKIITHFGNAIRIAAGYSFTLFLIHYTVMYSIKSVFDGGGLAWFLFAVAISNAIAFLIAAPFEMKHKQFAQWLTSLPNRLREKRSAEAVSSEAPSLMIAGAKPTQPYYVAASARDRPVTARSWRKAPPPPASARSPRPSSRRLPPAPPIR